VHKEEILINFAKVYLWDDLVGVVSKIAQDKAANFEFFSKFIEKNLNISPIKMPLANGQIYSFPELSQITFKGLPGLLADSLPDKFGNSLINKWLAKQGRDADSYTSIERLLYQGKRSMGALEFEPATAIFKEAPEKIELEELILVANQILSDKQKSSSTIDADFAQIIKIGTSAGGARAKAVIAYNEKTKEIRSGEIDAPKDFFHWILKFDGVKDNTGESIDHFGKIEFAYYKMASLCKIDMTQCRLLEENGRFHFMTRRFDRVGGSQKLHTQTLCAMQHFDFNNSGRYSYEQLFQTLNLLRLPYSATEQIYRRMAFNVIARNQDDHTKNFSFIMDKAGKWSLAPAYDVAYAYNPQGSYTSRHQMSINGKTDNFVLDDFLEVAKTIGVKKPKEIISEVLDSVSQWEKIAKEIDIDKGQIEEIKRVHRLGF
jgi:serine/threonine-protein kinase HipA